MRPSVLLQTCGTSESQQLTSFEEPKEKCILFQCFALSQSRGQTQEQSFLFLHFEAFSDFVLVGKIDAYVCFPQQLSMVETEVLHGEIAVWLHQHSKIARPKIS